MVGANVARYRRARGWTRTQLGQEIGHANGGYVSQVEARRRAPGPESLKRLAEALGVTPDALMVVYDPQHGP